tara:strand:+ start:224 stop:1354 length:1131 start_codon:yes stop_codon:yes gene_type:complete
LKKKLGFIGGGINSVVGNAHICASQMDNLFTISSGIFSKNLKTSLKTSKEWNIASGNYGSIDEFIKKEKKNLDAVVVLTPTPDHYTHVKKLLNNGINTICEKPISSRYNQALELSRLQKKNKVFLATTYNYTGYPMIREIKYLINKNKIGKINQIHCEYPMETFNRSMPSSGDTKKIQQWRLKDLEISNLYLDLGTHVHSLIKYLINEDPEYVISNNLNFSSYKNITDNLFVWLKYKKNIFVNCWISKTALGYRNGLKIRIFGTKGSIEWIQENPGEFMLYDKYGKKNKIDRGSKLYIASEKKYNRFKAGHPDGFIEAYANLYRDLYNELDFFQKNKKYRNNFFYNLENTLPGIYLGKILSKKNNRFNWSKLKYIK